MIKKVYKRLICLLHGHKWELIHEEGDWIMGTAKYIWLCPVCDTLNIAKPWKV